MNGNTLNSLVDYSRLLADLLDRPDVLRTTVAVWSDSPFTGTAEGEVFFNDGLRLRLREEIDFDAGLIAAYGYEVYRHDERLYWYDDFPHPNDPLLASTLPHHKHIPPDIKHHRIPASNIAFHRPNLPVLLEEIVQLLSAKLGQSSE